MTGQTGTIRGLYVLADGAGLDASPVDTLELRFGGVAGDRHMGLLIPPPARDRAPDGTRILNRRQVSLVALEECAAVAAAIGARTIDPAWIGSNMAVEGIPHLSDMPAGCHLLFPSGAVLYLSERNVPCALAGAAIAGRHGDEAMGSRFVKAAMGRRGVLAMVVREGRLSVGDAFRLHPPIGT